MKSNILVVDDEPVARQSMGDILRLEGFAVNSVPNGQAAIEYVRTHPVELLIVDLRMPGMDGLEVVQVVNQISPETEVVLLTAFATTESAPASPAQVIASVKKGLARRDARLKSRAGNATAEVDEGNAEFTLKDGTYIDLSRRLIRKKDNVIHLTPAEGRLLRVLIENPGRVYSHRELVLLVQGYDTSQREAPEILRPLVSRLRHKLESFPSLSDRIVSVRGTGYLYEGDK